MNSNEALHALALVLDRNGIVHGPDVGERYRLDVLGYRGEPPLAVLRPSNTQQVSQALAICHAASVPVVTQGGRTGLVRGHLPRSGEIVLSTERMTQIESIDSDAAMVTVQAGVILQVLQERVEPLGLMFPLDLGGRGSCTIGGNIATNAGGNRVIRYGMTRELVIGLEAVLADGTVLNGLKPVIKNNTGPDLKQLFIGSEGVLGVVTRAILRLVPKPSERAVALCSASDFSRVKALLRHVRNRLGGELTAFEVMWDSYFSRAIGLVGKAPPLRPGRPFYVLIEASGADGANLRSAMERALGDALEENILLEAVLAKSGTEIEHLWHLRDIAIEVSRLLDPIVPFDVSIAIADMDRFVSELDKAMRGIDARCESIVFGHVGDGNLHMAVHCPPDRPEAYQAIEASVYQLVGAFQGSVSAEHGIGILKRAFLPQSRTPEEIGTIRTLKAALDPRHILNRGRILEYLPPVPAPAGS